VAARPDWDVPHTRLAALLAETPDRAVPHWLFLTRRDGATPADWAGLVRALGGAARTEEAVEAARAAVAKVPDDPALQTALAVALVHDHAAEAALALRPVLYAGPRSAERRAALAEALAEVELYDRAEVEWSEAVRLSPDAPELWRGYGEMALA